MRARRLIETKLLHLTQQFLYQTGIGDRKAELDVSLQKHLGLSSLARLELFLEIEREFQFPFTDEMLAKIDTLRDVVKILCSKSSQIKEHYCIPKKEKHRVDPEKAQTLIDLLIRYANEEGGRSHIFFHAEERGEVIITYGEILEKALIVAHGLLEMGMGPGQKVAMTLPNHPTFFYVFFGILLAGCTPIPLDPLDPFRDAHPTNAITFEIAESLLKSKSSGLIMPCNPADFALNGITHQDLLHSIRSYGKGLKLTDEDIAVSWAPLYRDPGLMGIWLACFYYGIPLVLMTAYSFFRQPERWLWAIHYSNATISVGDRLAYEFCISKITPPQIEGLDLHSWRLSLHMGETIPGETLDQFAQKFARYGFQRESFCSVSGFKEPPIDLARMPQLQALAKETQVSAKPSFWKRPLKLLYTIYAGVLFLFALSILYCCSWILPSKALAPLLRISTRVLFAWIFCPIKIHHKQRLSEKAVFVANHASYIDALLFLAVLPPKIKIVGKEELANWPLIGRLMRKIGCIFIERADFPEGIQESVHKMEEALQKNSLLIFPEGTFSYAQGLRPFRLGAFKIACEHNTPIIPIATQGTRSCLRERTYLLRPVIFKIFVGDPIQPKGKDYTDAIQLRKEAKEFIAKHCGEPVLNLIVAGQALPDLPG